MAWNKETIFFTCMQNISPPTQYFGKDILRNKGKSVFAGMQNMLAVIKNCIC